MSQGRLNASDAAQSAFELYLQVQDLRMRLDRKVAALTPEDRLAYLDLIQRRENIAHSRQRRRKTA